MTSSLGMSAQYDVVDATAVRYAESPARDVPTLLLTSPWPESLFAFLPVWAELRPAAEPQPVTGSVSATSSAGGWASRLRSSIASQSRKGRR